MAQTTTLRLAVCIYPGVTALDFMGPVEAFGYLHPVILERIGANFPKYPTYSIEATYLAYTKDPILPSAQGPPIQPQRTYDELNESDEQFDILLIPGGPGARPAHVQPPLPRFILKQATGAKYILSVCTGAWILANTGLLNNRRATTNKAAFNSCKEATSKEINWVTKARWVVDGNIWTSSGITAGTDMASAFIEHLMGEDIARHIRSMLELTVKGRDDDEFADYNNLV